MRRSIAALAVLVVVLAGCGDDDAEGGSPARTTAEPQPIEVPDGGALAACVPLATIDTIFGSLEDRATASPEGRIAADAALDDAVEQLQAIVPEGEVELTAAVETLGEVSLQDADEPGPERGEIDAARASLDTEYGAACG